MLDKKQNKIKTSVLASLDQDTKNIHLVNSAPGSGKTTTVLNISIDALKKLKQKNEKMIILAFNKDMADEIRKKIKRIFSKEDLEYVSIKTVHSFFLGGAKKAMELSPQFSFEINYEKSFFTKKDITTLLKTLLVEESSFQGNSISDFVFTGNTNFREAIENKLAPKKIFNNSIMDEKNIKIIQNYINAFYTSIYSFSAQKEMEKGANFFAKNDEDAIITNISLDEENRQKIKNIFSSLSAYKEYSVYQKFFLLLIKQIDFLASLSFKEKTGEEIVQIPVEVKDERNKTISTTYIDSPKNIYSDKRIFLVPHSYYYKKFYSIIKRNPHFLKSFMGNTTTLFLDEAQDNDEIFLGVMLELFKKNIIKTAVCIGDTKQGIYSFRSPGHANILEFIIKNKKHFNKIGVNVSEHELNKTYRFGNEVAKVINGVFKSNIEGTAKESFIFPKGLTIKDCIGLSKHRIDTGNTDTIALITRTNQEAIKIFIETEKSGVGGFKLNNSIREDIKKFKKQGVSVFKDEKIKNILVQTLQEEFSTDKTDFKYDEILKSDIAKEIIQKAGYAHYITFKTQDIEDFLSSGDRSRNKILITTAHKAKGGEFDYVIIADDYLRNSFESNVSSVIDNLPQQEQESSSKNNKLFQQKEQEALNFLLKGQGGELKKIKINQTRAEEEINLSKLNDKDEEENILYVGLTRVKKGIFAMEGNIFKTMIEPAMKKVNNREIFINFIKNDSLTKNSNLIAKLKKDENPKEFKKKVLSYLETNAKPISFSSEKQSENIATNTRTQ